MVTTYAPFGAYSDVSGVVLPASNTLIVGEINKLKALIPDIALSVSAAHPDFDQIEPHTAEKLRAEIVSLVAAIAAAPTS